MNELHIEVKALDATHGYMVIAVGIVDGQRQRLEEHYATEALVQARLATVWNWWAGQVNSE